MKHIYYYITVVLLIYGCQSVNTQKQQHSITGKYEWNGTYGVTSNIILKKNNTFIYTWQTGLRSGTTNGKWELHGNALILNSDKQPVSEEDFKIVERDKTNNNQFEIKVIDHKTKNKLKAVSCKLMNYTNLIKEKSSNDHGNCTISFDEKSTILHFSSIGYKPAKIPVRHLNSNSFILEMKEEKEYRYFTNQKWYIKKGRIYNSEVKKDKYAKTVYYEKTKGYKLRHSPKGLVH